MPGSTKCHYHGGKTPSGAASPHFKTGRYSKHTPERLAARYEEARSDSELLALNDEIALTDALIADTLDRLHSGESGALFEALVAKWGELERFRAMGRIKEMSAVWAEVAQIIERGQQEYAAQAELRSLLEQRRKLVESERKRLVQMQQVLTAEQAMVFLGQVTHILHHNIRDRDTLSAIVQDIQRLVHHQRAALPAPIEVGDAQEEQPADPARRRP